MATLYVDNSRPCSGTAQNSGSSTTTLKVASFTDWNGPLAVGAVSPSSLQYYGLVVTAGTGAPAVTKVYKITSVDVTDPAKPVLTVDRAFTSGTGGSTVTPANDWIFDIYYGSNVNTGASATIGSGTTGPKLTIQAAMEAGGSGDNTVYVKGGTPTYASVTNAQKVNYTESSSRDYILYSSVVVDGKSFTIEGYLNTPGDGCQDSGTPQTLATTLDSVGNYATTPAGQNLDSSNFPVLRCVNANRSINIAGPITGTATLAFKYFVISNGGSSAVIDTSANSTTPSLSLYQCDLGLKTDTGLNYIIYHGATTGTSRSLTITDCKFSSKAAVAAIYVDCLGTLTMSGVDVNHDPPGTGSFAVHIKGTPGTTRTFSASTLRHEPTKAVMRVDITDCGIRSDLSAQAFGQTTSIYLEDCLFTDHVNIKRTKVVNPTQSAPIAMTGLYSFVCEDSLFECTANSGVAPISIGSDATAYTYGPDSLYRVVRRNICPAAAGTAASTITLDAAASATDAAYAYRTVRKIAKADGAQETRYATAYNGTTKVLTISPNWTTNPATGDLFEISEVVFFKRSINNCTLKLKSGSTAGHGLLIGQGPGTNYIHVTNCKLLNGDNGIVAKGEHCVFENCGVYGGNGACLIKGGNTNFVNHCTFVTATTYGGSSGPLQLFDTSGEVNTGSNDLEWQHDATCIGNQVINSIFIVESGVTAPVMTDVAPGAGGAALLPTAYPSARYNRLDYNVYCQKGSGVLAVIAGSNKADLAALQAAWATQCPPLSDNDANSSTGTITLASPSTGDFRVTGGSASRLRGSDGQLIGAFRGPGGRDLLLLGVGA